MIVNDLKNKYYDQKFIKLAITLIKLVKLEIYI